MYLPPRESRAHYLYVPVARFKHSLTNNPPTALAAAVNEAFIPSAIYLWRYDAYFVSCTAYAPPFAVILNGVKFFVNPVDMIYRDLVDPATGLCMTAIASGGAGPYVLGNIFLQNVLAVFDVGNAQMRFTSRTYY